MGWQDLKNRLRSLLRPGRFEADLDEELRSHLEMEIEYRMARGDSRRQAERAARLSLGGVEGIKEGCRDAWGSRFLQDLWRDTVGACRRLVRYRRHSLVVIGSLGLGLGAALVMFAMVDAVLLRPLPFHQPDRLVRFWETTPEGDRFSTSDANLADFREQIGSLSDLSPVLWQLTRPVLQRGGEKITLDAMTVGPRFFRTLGVTATLGRTFGDEEARHDGDLRSVVLSHGVWSTLFASQQDILGRAIDLDGHAWTVVGVLPPGFRYGAEKPQIYLPYRLDPSRSRGDHWLSAVGRLAPGATLQQARQEAAATAANLAEQYPEANGGWGVFLEPLGDSLLGPGVGRSQWILLSAVGLLLLLACVNVANLFMAQMADRQEELRLRRVLGSGRLRILQQLLTESLILALAGAAAGLVLAWAAVPWIRGLQVSVPRIDEMAVDIRVAAAAALLAVVSSLVAGLLPAWVASRSTHGVPSQRPGQRSSGAGRARSVLVACEVALACVLTMGAGLLMSSFQSLAAVDPGFSGRGVLLAQVDLPTDHYEESGVHVRRFFAQLVERTQALPGVVSAGATATSPFRGPRLANYVAPEEATDKASFVPIRWLAVTPGVFRSLGIPLLRGSDIGTAGQRRETVISAGLAARLWPGEDPIGRRMRWIHPEGRLYEVVGVVGEVQDLNLGAPPEPTVYLPQAIFGRPSMTLAVRAEAPATLIAPIRDIVQDLDHKLGSPSFSMLEEQRAEALSRQQLSLQVMSCFSLVALLLAAAGVYGVVAYSVSQRRRDLGVRLALGASPGRLVRDLTLESLAPVVLGLLAGLLAALALGGTLRSLLYETSPFEPTVVLAVALLLALVGAASAWLPASRAAKLDPQMVIRQD